MNPLEQSSGFNEPPQKQERSEAKRYKYCCRKCKHTEKGKKSCVCVVPLSQRRANLGEIGCQTCGCKGCSIEDYLNRGQDPEYKPTFNNKDSDSEEDNKKNICCKKCSKKHSKNHKACICSLPKYKRRNRMPSGGCKVCGCEGCNNKEYSDDESDSRDRSRSREGSSVNHSYDEKQYNFNSFDRSMLGKVIVVEYGLNPAMMGMGIPQRTPSYILGKPL